MSPTMYSGYPSEEKDSQGKHEHRADKPVLKEGQTEHLSVSEDLPHLLVPHLGEGRVHHKDEARCDGYVGGAHLEALHKAPDPGQEISGSHPKGHGTKYPYCKEPVDERKPPALSRHYSPPQHRTLGALAAFFARNSSSLFRSSPTSSPGTLSSTAMMMNLLNMSGQSML
jgi:hypothetical protein